MLLSSAERRRLSLLGFLLRAPSESRTFAELRTALPDAWPGPLAAARRKFERDKRALAEMGVALRWLPESHAYRLDRDTFQWRPIHLDRAEARAVLVTAELASGDSSTPFAPAARSGLARLRSTGEVLDDASTEAPIHLYHPNHGASAQGSGQLDRLWTAIRRRLVVTFRYRSPHSGEERPYPRQFEPWGLFIRGGRWHVIGREATRGEERTFAVDGVRDLEILGLPDGPEAYPIPASFDLAAAASRPPWMWGRQIEEVRLRVRGGLAQVVARALGPETAPELVSAGDDQVVRADVRNAPLLLDLVLSFSPWVRPLAPASLAATFDSRLDEFRRRHEGPPPVWAQGSAR